MNDVCPCSEKNMKSGMYSILFTSFGLPFLLNKYLALVCERIIIVIKSKDIHVAGRGTFKDEFALLIESTL